MKTLKTLTLELTAAAFLFALNNNARAAIVPVGGPFPANSWGQAFHNLEPFSYDHMEGVLVSGSTFENPGFVALSTGWATTFNTPTRIAASGTATQDLYWTSMFNDPSAVVWDNVFYSGGVAKAAYRLYYGVQAPEGALDIGYGWRLTFLDPSAALAPVPEPTTMIAGALLLLPLGASTVRVLRKNRKV